MGLVIRSMSQMGLGCAKTPAVAPHVEISPSNCIPESQIILHTRGSMPCWRIVFSTFCGCMSFYTARVKLGPRALSAQCPDHPQKRPCSGHSGSAASCHEPTFSPIGIYGISAGRSFRLDSGLFNNWAPLLRFGRKQPGEFCRGGRSDWGANRFVPLLNG
jgi:hypothetical protein